MQLSLVGIGVGEGAGVGLVTGVAVGVGTLVGDAQATIVSAIIVAHSTLVQRKSDMVRPFKSKGAQRLFHSSRRVEPCAPCCPDARKVTVFAQLERRTSFKLVLRLHTLVMV